MVDAAARLLLDRPPSFRTPQAMWWAGYESPWRCALNQAFFVKRTDSAIEMAFMGFRTFLMSWAWPILCQARRQAFDSAIPIRPAL